MSSNNSGSVNFTPGSNSQYLTSLNNQHAYKPYGVSGNLPFSSNGISGKSEHSNLPAKTYIPGTPLRWIGFGEPYKPRY